MVFIYLHLNIWRYIVYKINIEMENIMITDEEKIEWMDSKNKMWWSSVLCVAFEILVIISLFGWGWYLIYIQVFGLIDVLVACMVLYLLYLPVSAKNNNKLIEYVHISYMLYGTCILCYLTYTSGLTLVNLPVLIISLWCIVGCQSYRNFNRCYNIWKRLDDLLTIKHLKNDVFLINREIFNLDSEKDEDNEELKKYEEYKNYINIKIEDLENKYKD